MTPISHVCWPFLAGMMLGWGSKAFDLVLSMVVARMVRVRER